MCRLPKVVIQRSRGVGQSALAATTARIRQRRARFSVGWFRETFLIMDSFFGIQYLQAFLIAVIALVVLGRNGCQRTMRTVAGYFRQIRGSAASFTSQFSEKSRCWRWIRGA